VTQLVLLLPFVALGFSAWTGAWSERARRVAAGLIIALAVGMPVAMGLYTFRADGGVRDVLRPVSPTSTNLQPVMRAVRFLEEEVAAKGGALGLDADASYQDLQLGFFTGLPDERLVRLRWPDFRERLEQTRPEYLVRFDEGALVREPGVKLEGRTLTLGDMAYEELEGFAPPVHVYRRR
jgi:hypothetical protein